MIGDNAKRCIIEDSTPTVLFPRARVSFKNEPLLEGETPIENPNLSQTDGLYSIKYQPNKLFKWGAFLISCDLFDGKKIRVSSYEDMIERANQEDERAPFFKFLLEWTNINPIHFEIAKEHIIMPVPFCFNIEKYYKMIQKKKHTRKPGLVFRTKEEEEQQTEIFLRKYSSQAKQLAKKRS